MGLKKSVNPIPLSPPRDRGFFVGDSHIFFGRSEAEAQVEYQIRVDNCENCVSEWMVTLYFLKISMENDSFMNDLPIFGPKF